MKDEEIGAALRRRAKLQAEISKLHKWLGKAGDNMQKAYDEAFRFSRGEYDVPHFDYPGPAEVMRNCEAIAAYRKEGQTIDEKLAKTGIVFPLDRSGF